MNHLIPISGKDSLATALLQTAHRPDLEYGFLFNDTGLELPETYAWLDEVEKRLGAPIERVGKDLAAIIREKNYLPSHNKRYCTKDAKIAPMEARIGKEPTTVYFGLRADEPARVGYRSTRPNIIPAYPLREFGIDLRGVWVILQTKDLLPPAFFWQTLFDRVERMLEGNGDWAASLEPWERAALFAGRSRANDYICFYQRQYEWVWLHETHPDLFAHAVEMEEKHGANGYTWQQGHRLAELVEPNRARQIIDRRASQVATMIARRIQGDMFQQEESMLATTSCGLLCGK